MISIKSKNNKSFEHLSPLESFWAVLLVVPIISIIFLFSSLLVLVLWPVLPFTIFLKRKQEISEAKSKRPVLTNLLKENGPFL